MSEKKVNPEDWEAREDNDDELITSDDLVTEIKIFPQSGKPYLTLVGCFAMANREKITVTETKVEETEMSYRITCEGKNPDGDVRFGGHEEFKGNNATHAYAKAISKAQRNLFKAFLYGNATVKEAFAKAEEVLKAEKTKPTQQRSAGKPQQAIEKPQGNRLTPKPLGEPEPDNRIRTVEEMQAEPEPSEKDRGAYLRRYCFALYNEHNVENGDGRLPAVFWQNVKERFGVKSRTTMTVSHWQACLEQMREGIAKTKPGHYSLVEETDDQDEAEAKF